MAAGMAAETQGAGRRQVGEAGRLADWLAAGSWQLVGWQLVGWQLAGQLAAETQGAGRLAGWHTACQQLASRRVARR